MTQKDFAKMLGVSYPYLLSVETGQRDMSESLSRKISWLVGVSSTELRKNKRAQPMAFDDTTQDVVPFSQETYRQHCAQFPKFSDKKKIVIGKATRDLQEPAPPRDEVTPTLEGYAKVFHGLLDSAMFRHRLGKVMPLFFKFFAEITPSGSEVGAFITSVQKLYPEDREAVNAMVALLGRTYIPPSSPNLILEVTPNLRPKPGHPPRQI